MNITTVAELVNATKRICSSDDFLGEFKKLEAAYNATVKLLREQHLPPAEYTAELERIVGIIRVKNNNIPADHISMRRAAESLYITGKVLADFIEVTNVAKFDISLKRWSAPLVYKNVVVNTATPTLAKTVPLCLIPLSVYYRLAWSWAVKSQDKRLIGLKEDARKWLTEHTT